MEHRARRTEVVGGGNARTACGTCGRGGDVGGWDGKGVLQRAGPETVDVLLVPLRDHVRGVVHFDAAGNGHTRRAVRVSRNCWAIYTEGDDWRETALGDEHRDECGHMLLLGVFAVHGKYQH